MTSPSPADELERRLLAATMRFDWGDIPDGEPIPAVPLLREAAAEISALRAKLAEAMEVMRPLIKGLEFYDREPDSMHASGMDIRLGTLRAARCLVDGGQNG